MNNNRYRIVEGKHVFHTFKPTQVFNALVWLENDGRFEVDTNGQHYKFYNTDGTADTAKVQAEADQVARQAWKESRTLAVSQIIVTTASGKKFDGGETSQTRMSRAIAVLDPGETQPWILAENLPGELPVDVTKEELKEALRLAGKEQTTIWAY